MDSVFHLRAGVVELVDARDSKSRAVCSSPSGILLLFKHFCFLLPLLTHTLTTRRPTCQWFPHSGSQEDMAAIDTYTTKDGRTTYRVRVRRRGYPSQVATFQKL